MGLLRMYDSLKRPVRGEWVRVSWVIRALQASEEVTSRVWAECGGRDWSAEEEDVEGSDSSSSRTACVLSIEMMSMGTRDRWTRGLVATSVR